MNLHQEIEKIKAQGYNEDNAQSKLGQDIVLKAIYESGLSRNTTIKGGVVLRSISGEARRATQDLDLDLIRYSISDDSVRRFAERLNCIEGLTLRLEDRITELNHQDYRGKRIFISIRDDEGTSLALKIDIGVHKDLSIKQEEYAFDIGFQEDTVRLLINSPAQMITEKLKSLIRFGARNTRYKDVFDICYLCERVNIRQLKQCIQKYIFNDKTLHNVTNMDSIVNRIERVFINPGYLYELHKSDMNWLDIPIEQVIKKVLSFIKRIHF